MAARALLFSVVVFAVGFSLAIGQELKIISVGNEKQVAVRADEPEGPRYWLGVICQVPKKNDLKKLGVSHGLIVEEVIAKSPADQAGIKTGDLLLAFGEKELQRVEQLAELVARPQNKRTALRLLRNGQEKTLPVTLAQRPSDLSLAKPEAVTEAEDDKQKTQLLMEAAKKALEKLRAAKAKEDAAEQAHGPAVSLVGNIPAGLEVAVGKAEGGTASGRVRYQGATWQVTRETVDHLPEEIRGHLQLLFAKVEESQAAGKPAGKSVGKPTAEPVAAHSHKEIERLEKRIDEIDRKLDEVLKLIKARSEAAKKKKKQK